MKEYRLKAKKVFVGQALIALSLFLVTPATGFNEIGETAHFIGGGLVAGAVTATVGDTYWPEHRAMVGFAASTAGVLIGEGIQIAGGESFSSAFMDITCHTIGAAVGSALTDKYLLAPVVHHASTTGTMVGIVLTRPF